MQVHSHHTWLNTTSRAFTSSNSFLFYFSISSIHILKGDSVSLDDNPIIIYTFTSITKRKPSQSWTKTPQTTISDEATNRTMLGDWVLLTVCIRASCGLKFQTLRIILIRYRIIDRKQGYRLTALLYGRSVVSTSWNIACKTWDLSIRIWQHGEKSGQLGPGNQSHAMHQVRKYVSQSKSIPCKTWFDTLLIHISIPPGAKVTSILLRASSKGPPSCSCVHLFHFSKTYIWHHQRTFSMTFWRHEMFRYSITISIALTITVLNGRILAAVIRASKFSFCPRLRSCYRDPIRLIDFQDAYTLTPSQAFHRCSPSGFKHFMTT